MIVQENRSIKNNIVSFSERQEELHRQNEVQYKKKGSPYRRYKLFNEEYDAILFQLTKESRVASMLFSFLVKEMTEYNIAVCSYKLLQEVLEVSKPSIATAINLLRDKQIIEVYKLGNMNAYAINANIVWKTHGNKIKHARFKAHIALTETEQDKLIRKKINKEKEILNKGKLSD
jgi:hypothetical protein